MKRQYEVCQYQWFTDGEQEGRQEVYRGPQGELEEERVELFEQQLEINVLMKDVEQGIYLKTFFYPIS